MSTPRKRKAPENIAAASPIAPISTANKRQSASSKKKESEAERKQRIEELKRALNVPASTYAASSNASVERPAAKPSAQAPQQRVLPGKGGNAALVANAVSAAKSNAASASANAKKPASSGSNLATQQNQNESFKARNLKLRTGTLVRPSDSDENDSDDDVSSTDEKVASRKGNGEQPGKATPVGGVPQPQTDELDSSLTRKRKRSSLFDSESASSSLDNAAAPREILTAARRVIAPKQGKQTPKQPVPVKTALPDKKPPPAVPAPAPAQLAVQSRFSLPKAKQTTDVANEVRHEEQRRPTKGFGEHWGHNSSNFSFSSFHIPKRVRSDNFAKASTSTVLRSDADNEEMDTAEISDIDEPVAPAVSRPERTTSKPSSTPTPSRRIVYIVPDTNALMSDCQLLDRIFESTELAENNLALSPPCVTPQIEVNATMAEFRFVLPWIVIQELDKLKRSNAAPGNGSAPESAILHMENGARMYKARQAIRLVNTALRRGGTLRGQSAAEKDAAAGAFQFDVGANCTNDDRILQCCLQLRANCQRERQCAVYLYTYDLNLANKALVSTVGLVDRNSIRTLLRDGFTPEMNRAFANAQAVQPAAPTSATSVNGPPQRALVPPPASVGQESRSRTIPHYTYSSAREPRDTDMPNVEVRQMQTAHAHTPERRNLLYPDLFALKNAEQAREELNGKLADALLHLFSAVLETEMRAEYADWWLEVVLIRPPWHNLLDLLVCFNKHWIAVFSRVFGRSSAGAFTEVHKHAKALKLADNVQLVASLRDNGQVGALRRIIVALAARSKPYAAQAEALLPELGSGIDCTDLNPTISTAASSAMQSQPAPSNESAAQEPLGVSPLLQGVLSCLEALWQHISSEQVTLSAAVASASRGDAETRSQLGSVYTFLRTLLDVLNFWHTTDSSNMLVCDSNSNFMRSLSVFTDLVHSICLDGSTASHFSVEAVREFASSKHYVSEALSAFGTLLRQLQALLGRTNGENELDLDMDVADIC